MSCQPKLAVALIGCRRCSHSSRAAALYSLPFAALAAVVGYAVIGCRVSLAVALIGCHCCSPRSRVCRCSTWHAAFCSSCCRRLCRHRLLRRPHRRSLSAVAVARLACVPPTFLAYRSLLSLLSSAMPFSAVASASPSLSSAVAFAYLNCVCAAVLCCVARCCRWCRRHAVALIGLCRYSHCSCACRRSAWRATHCSPWCRRLAVALISCCRCSTHSLAVRRFAQRAAYSSRCRCRLCRPCLSRRPRRCSHRLSPLLNSTHSLAFSRSKLACRSLSRCCRRLCHH